MIIYVIGVLVFLLMLTAEVLYLSTNTLKQKELSTLVVTYSILLLSLMSWIGVIILLLVWFRKFKENK